MAHLFRRRSGLQLDRKALSKPLSGLRRQDRDLPAVAGRLEDFHDAEEAFLHLDAHQEGGLACTNQKLLEQQRLAILDLLKDFGKNLLMGNLNLINVSLPVKMFEPRSYLQKLADAWLYTNWLQAAAATKDPVERLRCVATWFVAGLQHVFQSWRKPFNPILGETWQAHLDDGTSIFLEQISHHPPVSAFQLIGPGAAFQFNGVSQPEVAYKANAIRTTARGVRHVSFPDGQRIEVSYPYYILRGILATAMPRGDVVGVARFVDHENRLCCEVTCGRQQGTAHWLLSRSEALRGTIFRFRSTNAELEARSNSVPAKPKSSFSSFSNAFTSVLSVSSSGRSPPELVPEEQLASCSGNWLSHLDWDGRRYWTLAETEARTWQVPKEALPSDARERADLVALGRGDLKAAQAAKEALETRQRADAKLRKDAGRH
ncbi:hypothetical protein WJX81_001449 [Elliptochloris bilobata]|uniref:Oxysterol-binding protein n=1 Tax=Elliptochloris bilobata TaxID=381761 RepID=A0AAW1QV53_9CHLO